MPIKLNSFILPDELIKRMKDNLKESQWEEIELGFALCKSPNNNFLKIGEECKGGGCSIVLPKKCKEKGDTYIAAYHTHFNESSRPSGQDLPIIYKRGLGCIGGLSDSKEEINCYIRIKPKDLDAISSFKDRLALIRDRFERRKEIDKFVSENFKVIPVSL